MHRTSRLLTLAAVLLVAVSCGGGDDGAEERGFDGVFAAISDLSGDARHRALVEQAETEGRQLTWYTSLQTEIADEIASGFEDEYDVEIGVYRASGETIVPRLLEEADAGFRGADVVEINGLGMFNLNDRELLEPYEPPARAELIAEAGYDGWTATTLQTFAATWNTERVPDAERPRTWEDLAEERFRGEVGIEAGDLDWYKTLWDYWVSDGGKSPEEADALFRRMARDARVVRGHTLLGQLTAAGEVSVAPNYAHRIQSFADEGAPVAWKPVVEPLIIQPNGIGLVRGSRHPATAVLFVDWVLSEGQKLVAEHGIEPVREDLSLAPGAEKRVVDFAALAERQEEWTERFERLLALGEEVESDE